jgi:hypothetical protein
VRTRARGVRLISRPPEYLAPHPDTSRRPLDLAPPARSRAIYSGREAANAAPTCLDRTLPGPRVP